MPFFETILATGAEKIVQKRVVKIFSWASSSCVWQCVEYILGSPCYEVSGNPGATVV